MTGSLARCLPAILGVALMSSACQAQWQYWPVRHLDADNHASPLPAEGQIVTESWNRVVAVPYIVYMPEKDRVLMLVSCDYPHQAMVLTSDDHGATWTPPRYVQANAEGGPGDKNTMATGLTNLGGGRLLLHMGENHWSSGDFGEAWGDPTRVPPAANEKPWGEWDPLLVDKNATTGDIVRLMSYCSDNLQPDGHFQGYVRFSADEGRTWFGEIEVPEWYAVNEVAFLRATDGNIVAACRTDNPEQFKDRIDHYGGLGVSISADDGHTWSKLNMLYEWGRHHPCMVLMPNGDIVMTYVVRAGYPEDPDGFPQFGIEAVVSRDNGQTWDTAHRYILARWSGNRKGENSWWPSSQATSTVLLPDGSLLTAYGTGYRGEPNENGLPSPRDVGLVHWRPAP